MLRFVYTIMVCVVLIHAMPFSMNKDEKFDIYEELDVLRTQVENQQDRMKNLEEFTYNIADGLEENTNVIIKLTKYLQKLESDESLSTVFADDFIAELENEEIEEQLATNSFHSNHETGESTGQYSDSLSNERELSDMFSEETEESTESFSENEEHHNAHSHTDEEEEEMVEEEEERYEEGEESFYDEENFEEESFKTEEERIGYEDREFREFDENNFEKIDSKYEHEE